MSKPIAPKAGYDTDIKAKYREQVWDAFAPGVADIIADTTGTLKAVLMPSAEGLEIEVALARGLREEQIVCVDRSAAVIATSKWRKRFPDVKFFASEVSAVGEKIAKAGWVVRVANLDLCGNFSDDTIDAVRGFLGGAPLYRKIIFAVTLAKGREGSALTTLLKKVGSTLEADCPRMACLFELCRDDVSHLGAPSILSQGSYTSGRVPMSWAAFGALNVGCTDDLLCAEFNRLMSAAQCRGGSLYMREAFTPIRIANLVNLEIDAGITWSAGVKTHVCRSARYNDWGQSYYLRDYVCDGRPPKYEKLWSGQWGGAVRGLINANFTILHSIYRKECFICGSPGEHQYRDGRWICQSDHTSRPLPYSPSPEGYVGNGEKWSGKWGDIHFGSYVVPELAWSGRF